MNAADYLILATLGISMVAALMRGLVSEVMSLAVWALALWISATTSGVFAGSFLTGIEQPAVRLGGAYISIFLLVLVLGGMLTWVIRRIIWKTGLSSTDRWLGALFGFIRGLLIVFAVVIFAGFTAIPKQPMWQQSLLLPSVQTAVRGLSQYLPLSVKSFLSYPTIAKLTELTEAPESVQQAKAPTSAQPGPKNSSSTEPKNSSSTEPKNSSSTEPKPPRKPAVSRPKTSTSKAN